MHLCICNFFSWVGPNSIPAYSMMSSAWLVDRAVLTTPSTASTQILNLHRKITHSVHLHLKVNLFFSLTQEQSNVSAKFMNGFTSFVYTTPYVFTSYLLHVTGRLHICWICPPTIIELFEKSLPFFRT